ncbi:hypothetical protein PAEAM_28640 [Paenibacillus sp. GM1FR]|uniref:MBL fold metallo-hydrolase n=1 Tax=Paenibacillus sp. GM1FR TaxID=2059267 RepID=UPI000C273B48|nr:MBL fold metallo-hydrolase [Paenibacillus sp. GM1FR]PJN59829.1 hypothetical protein PAEAM_28640 [Paenibacillus sp. GM1FR]
MESIEIIPHKKNRIKKKYKKKKLYFIHDITRIHDEDGTPLQKVVVVLFRVFDQKEYSVEEPPPEILDLTIDDTEITDNYEGQFVYVVQKENSIFQFTAAGNDYRARQQTITNNRLRSRLYSRNSESEQTNYTLKESQKIYSYHVNVGHGNCSLIAFNQKQVVNIWCIDCSDWDYRSKVNYFNNIKSCLEQIKLDFNISEININKFFLTHSHFDHFSGLERLIKLYAATNAEIWFNPYYSFSSPKYNQLLNTVYDRVKNNTLKVVISHPSNTTNNIGILNNNLYIVRTKTTSLGSGTFTIQGNVNDSSIVYKFSFGKKSIIFPGDIEEKGWNQINSCVPYLSNTTYYCISHHGSMNGHVRSNCPASNLINDVTLCNFRTRILILLGRDGAYPGIINTKVINDLGSSRIYRTDQDQTKTKNPIFFRINWFNDSVQYFW